MTEAQVISGEPEEPPTYEELTTDISILVRHVKMQTRWITANDTDGQLERAALARSAREVVQRWDSREVRR